MAGEGENRIHKAVPIVAVAVAVAAVVAIAVLALVPRALAKHAVTIPISAKGLDSSDGGTAIPVHATGADANGTKVDETFYVKSDGTGAELAEGEYALTVTASPIAKDGTVYSITGAASSATVDEDGKLALGGDIVLTPIAATDATDKQIDAAFKAAKGGGAADEKAAGKLKDAATKRRDDAVAAKKEAERKAAEKKKAEEEAKKNDPVEQARAQGLQVFSGTLHIYSSSHETWLALNGSDPNDPTGKYVSISQPQTVLVLDSSQTVEGTMADNSGRRQRTIDCLLIANGGASSWQPYDGKHVSITLDDITFHTDVSLPGQSAVNPRVLS